jgi:hypothetical protein
MSTFVIYARLSQIEANVGYEGITKWFTANPKRRICNCDYFKVRRNHVAEDLLKHSKEGVTLEENK